MAVKSDSDKVADNKMRSLDTVMGQIEKSFGKGAVMRLGDEVRVPIEVIPTGSISLDLALGIGGLPRGRVIEIYGPESSTAPLPPQSVTFNRLELNRILNLYGRMVADGEWRDYAIDFLKDRAVFSIFRRASEVPLYRIEKDPRLARKQGAYSVVGASGQILRRGHDLDRVLLVIDRKLALV